MAIPSTTYDIATATNPTSALTDFTFMIDLSRMSAAWWAEVDTSDGTRGRASKNDGTTELATDWIDFNDTAETGWLRVKWTGTLASSGTQIVRVYPPNTGNVAYGVSDTYGQYNAYDSDFAAYYPNGGGTDRTSGQTTLSGAGSISEGDSAGKIGVSTSYDGSTQYFEADSTPVTSQPLTFIVWAKPDVIGYKTAIQLSDKSQSDTWYALTQATSGKLWEWCRTPASSAGGRVESITNNISTTSWNQYTGLEYTSSSRAIRLNNSNEATNSTDLTPTGLDRTSVGRAGDSSPGAYFDGLLQEVQIHSAARSDSHLSEEYNQTNDNATFWGTWTNVPVSGTGYELTLDTGVFTYTGNDLNLLKDSILETNTGVFNLTGNNLEFSKTNVLTLETGVFNLTGKSLSLIYDDGSQSAGSSPLGNRPKSYTKRQKQLYYIDKILRGI